MALERQPFSEALPWANNDGACQGQESTNHVDHSRTGVVGEVQFSKPSHIVPRPVAVDGIDDSSNDEAIGEVGVDFGALGHRSRDDRCSGACEDHLEQPANQIGVAEISEEETLGADKASGSSAAHHQGVAKRPEPQRRYAEVEKRLRHVVDCVLGANQARSEEGESRLHEKY